MVENVKGDIGIGSGGNGGEEEEEVIEWKEEGLEEV